MELLINSKAPEDAIAWTTDPASSSAHPAPLLGRGHFSMLGCVRRKPSRADAEPSLSKSCTDKLAVKQFTSILSFPADLFVAMSRTSFIQSIVVYHDQHDRTSYERAFGQGGRLGQVKQDGHFFEIKMLPEGFPRFPFEKVSRVSGAMVSKKPKASNISALWIQGPGGQESDVLETLVNGVKQGYRQFEERRGKESVLCRRKMWELGQQLSDLLGKTRRTPGPDTFDIAAEAPAGYNEVATALRSDTYAQAKASNARERVVGLRHDVVSVLGNWIRNTGDETWGLDVNQWPERQHHYDSKGMGTRPTVLHS